MLEEAGLEIGGSEAIIVDFESLMEFRSCQGRKVAKTECSAHRCRSFSVADFIVLSSHHSRRRYYSP